MYYHINKNTLTIISGPHDPSSNYVRKITRCGTPEALNLMEYDFVPEVKPSLDQYQSYGDIMITNDAVIFPVVDWTQEQIEEYEAQQLQIKRSQMTCTPRQGLLALEQANLLDAVESYINTQSRSVKIDYERATEWKRTWPILIEAATFLNLSNVQIDELFDLAVTF